MEPTLDTIREAAERIRPFAHRTPVVTCASLDEEVGTSVFLKCENFQKVGAFKFRGACNTVLSLSEFEASKGVATHSSGNHAQAVALAAAIRGIPAYIVMPENAPRVKLEAVKGYGGRISLCEPTLAARETTLAEVVAETQAEVIHPYNDYRVIAGQGTAVIELIEEVPDLDVVLVPVGGGGLLSGTAIAAHGINSQIRVIAAEPEQANDAFQSLRSGRLIPSNDPTTIADGLRTSLGDRTFPIIQREVEQIVTVAEESIIGAMRFLLERAKIVVEPSACVRGSASRAPNCPFGSPRRSYSFRRKCRLRKAPLVARDSGNELSPGNRATE